jgi:hypothetical protein
MEDLGTSPSEEDAYRRADLSSDEIPNEGTLSPEFSDLGDLVGNV